MSTASTIVSDGELELDAESAFDYVMTHPAVCSHCFSRVRDDTGARRVADGVPAFDVEDKNAHGSIRHFEMRTTCGQCGSIGCGAADDTLSLRAMLERVPALVARLREHGIQVDETAVRECVRECKSREALQGYDSEIFERAVAFGIERQRARPQPR